VQETDGDDRQDPRGEREHFLHEPAREAADRGNAHDHQYDNVETRHRRQTMPLP
jgi:hypothetical protein